MQESQDEIYQKDIAHTPVELTVSIYPANFRGPSIESITIPAPDPAGALLSEYRGHIQLDDFRLWDIDAPYLYPGAAPTE